MWSQEGKKVGNRRYSREEDSNINRRYFDSGMRSSK
jgi:hypothetical protein